MEPFLIEENNLTELWERATTITIMEGVDIGSRDGATHEILNATLVLTNPQANFVLNPIRKASPVYAAAELLWYLSGTSNAEMIMAYAPQYKRFCNEDGKHGYNTGTPGKLYAHGAYGDRLFRSMMPYLPSVPEADKNQLRLVIQLLKDKPESRQAVLQLWRPSDLAEALYGIKKDLPCTLSMQLLLRDGKLHATVNMRSNDLWLGTPYDIFCWSTIQMLIADELGVGYGNYVHHVGSLHYYERNRESILKNVEGYVFNKNLESNTLLQHKMKVGSLKVASECVRFERLLREYESKGIRHTVPSSIEGKSILADCAYLTAEKWTEDFHGSVESPLFRKAMELCPL